MRAPNLLRCALLASLTAALAPAGQAQQVFFVDPNPAVGDDTAIGTTPLSPFLTLFHAAQTAAPGSTIVLLDGVYDSSTQPFPVQVDRPLTFRGLTRRGARIDAAAEFLTTFEVQAADVVFEGFQIASGSSCIRVLPGILEPGSVTVRDMNLSGFRGVNVQQQAATSDLRFERLTVEGCRIECSDAGLVCSLNSSIDAPTPEVIVRSTRIDGIGAGDAVRLRLLGQAQLRVDIEGTVLFDHENGLTFEIIGPTSELDLDVRQATISGNEDAFGGGGAGIRELGPDGFARVDIDNTIFWKNFGQNDLPDYRPLRYTLRNCIVEQTDLIGVGGSFASNPKFVEQGTGDFHLKQVSPAIDAGVVLVNPAADLDGDPRTLDCGTGLPDIGADEYVPDYLYLVREPEVGSTRRARILADPGDLFVLAYVFNGGVGGLCDYPLPSSYQLVPGGVGTVAANNFGEVALTFPDDPALVGLEFTLGGVLGTSTLIRLMNNLHVTPIGG